MITPHLIRVSNMKKHHVTSDQVAKVFNAETGGTLTAKDIDNLCKNPETKDEIRFCAQVASIYTQDPNAIVEVRVKPGKVVDWVFLQSSEMRRNYIRFLEVISMDTTYHVNSLDMHLVTVMEVDNEGHGRAVAHGIINNEKEELLTKFMSAFTKFNTLECAQTEAVLVDKSWMEINAVQSVMPIAKIHLCVWHALRAMRLALPKLKEERQERVMELVKDVVYAYTKEKFDEALEVLYDQPDLQGFKKYFQKNWVNCKHKWAQYQRKGVPTFETRTTNYLESFHQKLKRLVTKNTTINDLVCLLHTMSEEKCRQEREREMVNSLKVSYNLRHDNEVTRTMYEFSSKYAAKKAMAQYELALSRGTKMRSTEQGEDVYEVEFGEKRYTITLGDDGFDCTCGFYLCNRIFCQHAWFTVFQYERTFLRCWVKRRWNRDMNAEEREGPQVPSSSVEKHRQLMMVLKEVGAVSSVAAGQEWLERKKIFDWLYDLFVKGGTVTLRAILLGLGPGVWTDAAGAEEALKGEQKEGDSPSSDEGAAEPEGDDPQKTPSKSQKGSTKKDRKEEDYMGGTPRTPRTPSGPTQFSSTPRPGYGANSGMDTPEGGSFIPNVPSSPFVRTPKVPKWTEGQEREERDYVKRMSGKLTMTDEDGTILPEGTPFSFRQKQVKDTPRRRSAKAPNKGKVIGPSTGEKRGKRRPLDEEYVFGAKEEEPATMKAPSKKKKTPSERQESPCTGS